MNVELLLQLLCCPRCQARLVAIKEALLCTSADCRRKYLVKEEIPIMLIEHAVELTPDEWSVLSQRVHDA